MCERERLLFILLAEAYLIFKNNCADILRGDVNLIYGDSINIIENSGNVQSFDVVYLDPMYPKRKKASALPKKKLQALRIIAGEGQDDVDGLLKSALDFATKRVVLKRPPEADVVGGRCNFSVESKLARFDVYLT
jgi:16S rRNA (guanine1516-N2)-methyltransferase